MARSWRPSWSKSATATEYGWRGVVKFVAVPNPPVPLPSRLDTLVTPLLVTARSALPSPLKLPTATPRGVVLTVNGVAVPKPPVPLPSSTEMVVPPELVTARSGALPALKAPTVTAKGLAPTAKLVAAPKLPVPVPKRTDTLFVVAFAITRSLVVPASNLPTATDVAPVPPAIGTLVAAPNPPTPLPRRIDTLFVVKLATARSRFASALKVPTATQRGLVPTVMLVTAPKLPVPVPSSHRHGVRPGVGRHDVEVRIGVEGPDSDRPRVRPHREARDRAEGDRCLCRGCRSRHEKARQGDKDAADDHRAVPLPAGPTHVSLPVIVLEKPVDSS